MDWGCGTMVGRGKETQVGSKAGNDKLVFIV
jgi:hypothetical protein